MDGCAAVLPWQRHWEHMIKEVYKVIFTAMASVMARRSITARWLGMRIAVMVWGWAALLRFARHTRLRARRKARFQRLFVDLFGAEARQGVQPIEMRRDFETGDVLREKAM